MSLDIITASGRGTAKAASVNMTLCAGSVVTDFVLTAEEADALINALSQAVKEGRQEHDRVHREFLKKNGLCETKG